MIRAICFVSTRTSSQVRQRRGALSAACRFHGLHAQLLLVHRPGAGRGKLEQVAVRITKVKATATQFPRALLLHRDTSLLKPRLPVGQFTGWDCEREVQLAISVVRRRNCSRSTLLE